MSHPLITLKMVRSKATRFWKHVDKRSDGCWIWTGECSPGGYGRFRFKFGAGDRPFIMAHRAAFIIVKGQIPVGKKLDHLCRNPACVNTAHLEPVTHRENILRGVGITARNAKAVVCKNGHDLSGWNVIWRVRDGYKVRECRTCHNSSNLKGYYKKRGAA